MSYSRRPESNTSFRYFQNLKSSKFAWKLKHKTTSTVNVLRMLLFCRPAHAQFGLSFEGYELWQILVVCVIVCGKYSLWAKERNSSRLDCHPTWSRDMLLWIIWQKKEISGLYEQALTVQGRPEILNQFKGRISATSECNCRFSLVPFITNHIQIKSLINMPSVFVTNVIAGRWGGSSGGPIKKYFCFSISCSVARGRNGMCAVSNARHIIKHT